MNQPKLSVCIITYNQEAYIHQAIESVLTQQCDFKFEIVIGEDNSSDHTGTICQEYKEQYPQCIRVLKNEQNLGMNRNFMRTLQACKGEYIAVLEGDDYWTSPYKLQKQVDFLDTHPAYLMCFHDAQLVKNGEVIGIFSKNRPIEGKTKSDLTTEDILSAPIRNIHLASLVFRNQAFKKIDIPDWIYDSPAGDLPLTAWLSAHGKSRYHNDLHCIYRIHSGGITNRRFDIKYYKRLETMFMNINDSVGGGYEKAVKKGLKGRKVMFYENQLTACRQDRKFGAYFYSWLKLVQLKKHTRYSWRDLLWLLRQYFKR